MTRRNIIITGLLILGAGILLLFSGINGKEKKISRKRTSPFYNGLPVKTIRTSSEISLAGGSYPLTSVLQGDQLEHDFFIDNKGSEILKLRNAKSCCGYLLTHYDRQIQPGERGKISILVLTDKFGGKTVRGKITADLLGVNQPRLELDVSMQVKKFVDISKHSIELIGSHTQELKGETVITTLEQFPFKITGLRPKKGYFFDFSFEKRNKGSINKFVITVKNKVKKPAIYRDVLFVQTDSQERPELKIRVKGKISE